MPADWPDVAHLQLLVAVSEATSLGAAARAIGMAQPNASRALRQLEHRLGLTLVDRSPAGSHLTAEGALVVDWAREVLAAADRLSAGAEALRGMRSAVLTVGASMTVAEYLVPHWLGEFRRRRPEVRVSLGVHNSQRVCDLVADGSCRVGFVESPSIPKGLHTVTVGRDRLVVVVSPGHPWARRRRPVSADELAATPLIVREPGSGTRITVEQLLRPRELAAPVLELSSNAAVRISTASGAAPAVLSDLAVEGAIATGELLAVPVEGVDFARTLRAVWESPRRLVGPEAGLVQIASRTARSRGRN